MRAERCEVELDDSGNPAEITWQQRTFTVSRILRTYCTGGPGKGGLSTPLLEHWMVLADDTTLHVYVVDYGPTGRPGRREVVWWLAAIDPDPRGFMRLM